MKAYLETIVILHKGNGSTSCSQVILEFEDWTQWESFKSNLDEYEKGTTFEVYRTLVPMW